MKSTKNFNNFQPIIITAFWALLFASPLLFGRFENEIEWDHIFIVWLNYLPLLLVFIVNRYILLPKLLFKGKKIAYFSATFLLICSIAFSLFFFHPKNNTQQRRLPPPPERSQNMDFQRPEPPRFNSKERLPMPSNQKTPDSIPPYANFLILAILLVGFDAGLKISMRWAKLEQEKMKLQTENIENQLAILKNQVSPHFFMNTLNNIHALVDIDTDEAKKAIIKLSNLMRHLLYDSEEKMTPIKKEIEFIESYIELMRLRFSNKVKINVEIPSEIPHKFIAPLLFTSLLENAFKHGISYHTTSFINLALSFNKNNLNFIIENSNHPKKDEAASGIGVENTKKRLDLIYKNKYTLVVDQNEKIYRVNLTVPI
ncbi:sensor histidine kinase [Lutibacter holmesii]|uniref:Sensor histidine kinase n=1 Tax=Lutibacter holmesii TaxID=1137985 RepID=A0ABW3WP78_9FLAO